MDHHTKTRSGAVDQIFKAFRSLMKIATSTRSFARINPHEWHARITTGFSSYIVLLRRSFNLEKTCPIPFFSHRNFLRTDSQLFMLGKILNPNHQKSVFPIWICIGLPHPPTLVSGYIRKTDAQSPF